MNVDRMKTAGMAALLLPFAIAAHAEGLAFEASTGVGISDNVTRVETNEIDETIATGLLKFSYDKYTKRITADVAGNFAYNDYLDDTYESDLIGNFAGAASFALVEDRVFLIASDYFGQVLGDPFAPSTPDNHENLNYLTTGMRANFNFTPALRFEAGGSYAVATYETTLLDSTNVIWDAGLTRTMSSSSTIGLNVRQAEFEYDDDVVDATNYDQSEGFLRYTVDGARTKLSIDAGYGRIDRDVAGVDSGLLFRVEAARSLSGRSTLTFDAGQEFSNSAAAFASSQSGQVLGLASESGQQTGYPFLNQHASLSWDILGARTGITVAASWQKQVYDDLTFFDQSFTELAVTASRDWTPTLSTDLNLSYGEGHFELRGGNYSDLETGLSLKWNMTRHLALSATYDYLKRQSNTTGGDYTENRAWLLIVWQQGAPRGTMRPPQFTDQGS